MELDFISIQKGEILMRIWGKCFYHNRLVQDSVVENNDTSMSRTQKVLQALQSFCNTFDLSIPIWLNTNITEFQRIAKTRFRQENFIETIDFDFLEIQVIEEDFF